jgi:transposase
MRHHGLPEGTRRSRVDQATYRKFVGIDWATQAHQLCVINPDRRVLEERSVEHSGTALAQCVEWLTRISDGDPGSTAVAIETPRGAIVEVLVERGFHVYAVNPKQLDRFRDRHTVAGAKDDRRDAFVLADSLRTDQPCFRRVQVDDPLIIQVRELSRVEDDLRQEANRLENRLREQLHRFFPQMLRFSPAADEPWLWALVELAPTPAAAARLRAVAVKKLLRAHRIRRVTAEEVLRELKTPALQVAPGAVEAACAHIELLLPRLRLVHAQRAGCARRLEALLEKLGPTGDDEGQQREHRDVRILRSLPGVGRVVAATMLAEASQPLAERDYHALRTHCGVAPVTKQSGKRAHVVMRHSCNGRLRNALYHWARVSTQADAHSRAQYAALRKRGHTHGRALRSVADRLLRVLVAMLKNATLFDPNRPRRVPAGEASAVSA